MPSTTHSTLVAESGKLVLEGQDFAFAVAKPSIDRPMKDRTDSSCWDPVTRRLYRKQKRGRVEGSIAVEFNFITEYVKTLIFLAAIYGDDPVDYELYLSQDPTPILLCKGKTWIAKPDLNVAVKEAEIITGSATLELDGIIEWA
jgi:hypothetical protein